MGYAVGVLSTLATIQEEQENPKGNVQMQQEHLRQLNQMQQQLDHMTRQIALIERRTR
ncbi:MAG TPA: hypothetical protein VNU45_03080 [Rummeliibacillus sp.]|nr:hypothetical protein [Rummeliibacillus sp.]